ncbi:NUDIX hydrolase [Gimesia aquarii]|uniref:RNA pyrophosphohydrolase n=1 Tax=Gimesia aquarii TaxID=2527964 RepID=A0A517VSB3_9PLAN|nr:NUDIX domain-containing protein [Gimesia aquarii]QDT95860.1 RNA pyrophosphohydrolase [Gimesia aquarii]
MKQRNSARAILLNNRSQLLLIQHQDSIPVDPAQPDVLKYWATPGGGIEAGEQPVDALQRELREELTLENVTIGRQIGVRNVSLNLPGEGCVISHEIYFVCYVSERPELNPAGLSECEYGTFKEIRWWSLEELHNTTEILRPSALTELVENALCVDSELVLL